ncbi:MAG: hypothetical protein ACI4WW_06580 [Candidatus Coprovivens sp.]
MKKVGPYTILEQKENDTYYFYPTLSIVGEPITRKSNILNIVFDITPYNDEIYSLTVSVSNKDITKFTTYTMYLIKESNHIYNIITILNSNEIEIHETIDFTTLDYENFINLLMSNSELQRIIPELKKQLELDKENLNSEKETAKIIDIPTKINYYQNITGYIIDTLEHIVTTEDELSLSKEILKSVKRTHEVVLYNAEYCHLAYLSLYANIVFQIKSDTQKNTRSLDTKELKCDTNKKELSYIDLEKIISSFINKEEVNEELNIIQERIAYELNSKPRVKTFTNHMQIILADDKYIDETKRVRAIKEKTLKELICLNLKENNYRILPRNEAIVYNYNKDTNMIDFIAIISIDLIEKILKLITIDMNSNTKPKTDILRAIDNLIKSNKVNPKPNNIRALIYTLIMIEIYYYKNINDKLLLFSSGQNIINLDYKNGGYDISVINRNNNRLIGKLSRITEETKEKIRVSLNTNEKEFNTFINNIIMHNIVDQVSTLNIDIDIKDISHQDIFIMFNRTLKKDVFRGKFTLDELLVTLTNAKINKIKKSKDVQKHIEEEKEPEYIYGIYKTDYEYIIRKSKTISEIMENNSSKNKVYLKISDLYNQFKHAKNPNMKKRITLELGKLLEIEDIKTEE